MAALDKRGSRWLGGCIVASAAVGALIFVAMLRLVGTLDPSVGEIQFTFTEPAFRRILEAWGPDGQRRFAAHFAYDYPFLVCFGVFGWALGTWLAVRLEQPRWLKGVLPWLMPLAAGGDAVEDVIQQALAAAAPGSRPAVDYLLAGCAATMKWGLIALFTLIVLWAWRLVSRQEGSGRTATAGQSGR
jgi:hypothetical protein